VAGRRHVDVRDGDTAAAGLKIGINVKMRAKSEERGKTEGQQEKWKEGGTGQEIGWGDAGEGKAGREAEDGTWETQVRGTKRGCQRTSISAYKHRTVVREGLKRQSRRQARQILQRPRQHRRRKSQASGQFMPRVIRNRSAGGNRNINPAKTAVANRASGEGGRGRAKDGCIGSDPSFDSDL
jgi:hypothetical protein